MKSNTYFRIVNEIDPESLDDTVTLPLPVLSYKTEHVNERERAPDVPATQLGELINLIHSLDAKLDELLKSKTVRKKAASKKTASKKTASKKHAPAADRKSSARNGS